MTGAYLRINRRPLAGIRTLGPGTRVVVWTQGCRFACPGCTSMDTWDEGAGVAVDPRELASEIVTLADGHDGLTISGGEPFLQPGPLAALCDAVRERTHKQFDILVYTGFRIATLRHHHAGVLERVDAVIDGRFEIGRETRRPWRGSDNQRLHRLTPLAETRYAQGDEPELSPARLQAFLGSDGKVEYVGIPRRGEMDEIENRIAAIGIRMEEPSWRVRHK